MLNIQIQSDSDIPASKQLFDQIQFAIASGQYLAGHRLPSTRQLAMITGLHRNTISKVYQQLEEVGLVESIAGSGIYVKADDNQRETESNSSEVVQNNIIKDSIDELLALGCTINQIQELFIAELEWRVRCHQQLVVTVPTRDLSAGELMRQALEQSLGIAVKLVPLQDLAKLISETHFGTVITSRYFIREVLDVVPPRTFRVLTVDIYDYAKELEIVKTLPSQACLGIVSLSEGTLKIAQSIVSSQRGEDVLVLTAPINDSKRIKALIHTAHKIISDPASYPAIKAAIAAARDDLIRFPEVICSENYIAEKSINLLKRELGLSGEN
ncbi:MAG: GntR family transcriptional regulator [Stanieria sp.]